MHGCGRVGLLLVIQACGFPRPDVRGDATVEDAPKPDARMQDGAPDADMTSPAISITFPAQGSTGVARNTTVSITFTEAVLHVDGTSLTLKQGSTPVSASVSMTNPSIHELTPSATLAANTNYTVYLSNAITDTSNNPLTASNFSFVTGP